MIWIRERDGADLEQSARALRVSASVITGHLDELGTHLAYWLTHSQSRVLVVGTNGEDCSRRIWRSAHSYDAPSDVATAGERLTICANVESLTAELPVAATKGGPVLHWHFSGTSSSAAIAEARALGDRMRAAGANLVRSFVVSVDARTTQSSIEDAQAEVALVSLPSLLAPSSTRRWIAEHPAPLPREEPAVALAPIDGCVADLLTLAIGATLDKPSIGGYVSRVHLPTLDEAAGVGAGAPSFLPAQPDDSREGWLADEEIEIYAEAVRRTALTRSEMRGEGGAPLLVLHDASPPDGRPALVIANAFGMSLELLEPLMQEASRRFWPVTWQSRHVPAVRVADPADVAADQIADLGHVLERFGGEEATLLGWCNGAHLALEVALANPSTFGRLVLLAGVFPGMSATASEYQRKLGMLLPLMAKGLPNAEAYCRAVYGTKRLAARGPSVTGSRRLDHLVGRPFRTPLALHRYARHFEALAARHTGSLIRRASEATRRSLSGRITLAVAPDDDIATLDDSRACAAALGGAKVRQLASGTGGHYILAHRPDLVMKVLAEGA